MGGIEQSGWHLVYNDKPNTALQYSGRPLEKART